MASNHKLTGILAGRAVTGLVAAGTAITLTLDDGGMVTIQTGGAESGPAAGVIKAIRQAGTTLDIDYQDGTTLAITLAEETSCVMVRDKNHVMEYAD